jgi:hypothetical protein
VIDWDALVIGPTVATFGEPVTYNTPSASLQITGVFDEAYIGLSPFGARAGAPEPLAIGLVGLITTEKPVLGVQLSQFPGDQPDQNDTVIIRGNTYEVQEVRIDSHGWAMLTLNLLYTP